MPELSGLRVGALLGGLHAARVGLPGRAAGDSDRILSCDIRAVEGLGVRPQGPRPEADGFALVITPAQSSAARVHRQDRDRLAELPEAGDEPSA